MKAISTIILAGVLATANAAECVGDACGSIKVEWKEGKDKGYWATNTSTKPIKLTLNLLGLAKSTTMTVPPGKTVPVMYVAAYKPPYEANFVK